MWIYMNIEHIYEIIKDQFDWSNSSVVQLPVLPEKQNEKKY